ncbi:hypothetical protein VVS03_02935 [Corynebacterium sp. LK2537]|uniref:hypothetical protein n=1 Tax=Corynebacterium sp. LK2537 TaxID=3110471 RepID=UPI0034CF6A16
MNPKSSSRHLLLPAIAVLVIAALAAAAWGLGRFDGQNTPAQASVNKDKIPQLEAWHETRILGDSDRPDLVFAADSETTESAESTEAATTTEATTDSKSSKDGKDSKDSPRSKEKRSETAKSATAESTARDSKDSKDVKGEKDEKDKGSAGKDSSKAERTSEEETSTEETTTSGAAGTAGSAAETFPDQPGQLTYVRLSDGMHMATANERESRPALSLIKLYIAEYVVENGKPEEQFEALDMVANSSDESAEELYEKYPDSIEDVAERYSLKSTQPDKRWGYSTTSTFDVASFVAQLMDKDPLHPVLVAMSHSDRFAEDGYAQDYGTSQLDDVVGTKFGWSNEHDMHSTVSFGHDFVVAANYYGDADDLTDFVTAHVTDDYLEQASAAARKSAPVTVTEDPQDAEQQSESTAKDSGKADKDDKKDRKKDKEKSDKSGESKSRDKEPKDEDSKDKKSSRSETRGKDAKSGDDGSRDKGKKASDDKDGK